MHRKFLRKMWYKKNLTLNEFTHLKLLTFWIIFVYIVIIDLKSLNCLSRNLYYFIMLMQCSEFSYNNLVV